MGEQLLTCPLRALQKVCAPSFVNTVLHSVPEEALFPVTGKQCVKRTDLGHLTSFRQCQLCGPFMRAGMADGVLATLCQAFLCLKRFHVGVTELLCVR
jgi:hypothetical protein